MTTVDTILIAEQMSSGADTVDLIARVIRGSGGKGLIAAAALAACDVDVQLLSLVSSDYAPPVHPRLDLLHLMPLRQRMVSTWIVIDAAHSVSHTYVDLGETGRSDRALTETAVRSFIEGVGVLYVTAETGGLLKHAARTLKLIARPAIVNLCTPLLQILSDYPGTLLDLISSTSAVIANETEWRMFQRALDETSTSWRSFPGLKDVIVTAGARGGRFTEAPFDTWDTYDAVPCVPRCVVGAGDTFNGAYVAARWVNGSSLAEACRSAATIASRKVSTDAIHLLG